MSPFAMVDVKRLRAAFVVVAMSIGLAGCLENALNPVTTPLQPDVNPTSPLQTKFHPSDEDVQAGVKHLQTGAFGLAQENFQRAVERSPKDVTAWIGLAASYDRLRRFDLADRAYQQAIKLEGVTLTILNNRGYSYLLRGDVVNARTQFMNAYRLDPSNAAVVNNLRLLDGSRRHVKRLEGAY